MIKLLKYWANYKLPEGSWDSCQNAIIKLNTKMLSTSSLLGSIAFILFSIFPFFIEHAPIKGYYYLAMSLICLVIYILSTRPKRGHSISSRMLFFLMILFWSTILLYGLMIGIYWRRTSTAVTFLVLFILMNVMFLLRPATQLTVQLVEIIIFCICTVIVKPATVYMYDIVNMLVAFLASSVINWNLNRMRIVDIIVTQQMKKDKQKLREALNEIEEHNKNFHEKVAAEISQLEDERQASQFIFDSNPQINFIIDLDFNIIDCNPAALKFYGYKNKDELKKGVVEKIVRAIPEKMPNGAYSTTMDKRLLDAHQQGETSFETLLTFDGEAIPFHFNLKRVQYKDSQVITVYQTDLRNMKKVEKDLERRDALLSAVNAVASRLISVEDEDFLTLLWESIAILGKSVEVERVTVWKNFEENGDLYCTQIHEWCEGVERQHGLEHTINIKYAEVVPTWEKILRAGNCINAMTKNMIPVERVQMERQGIASMLVVPIFIRNNFWGYVGYDDCINERTFSKEEETTLKSGGIFIASAILRNEITDNLVIAKDEALSSARAKGDFLAQMSHEIRTPLNAIIGMNNIAISSDDIDKAHQCHEKIANAAKHLLSVINDILDMSKIEANKFELSYSEFNFEKMLMNIINVTNFQAEMKKQELVVNLDNDVPTNILGDELRLSQAITNLISNAVKFTPEGGSIILNVKKIDEKDGETILQIEVIDNGIGISEEQQSRLFKSFEQADNSTSRKFGGTGLGLAITKRIFELMGGRVWIDSELGKGATFAFIIPAKRCSEQSLAKISPGIDKNDLRILVVDNSEKILSCFSNITVAHDLHYNLANTSKQALEMIRQCDKEAPYNLFFIDWNLSEIDSFELAKEIKKINNDNTIVCMAPVTTWNKIRKDAMHAGMQNVVLKPLFPSLVINALNESLGTELNNPLTTTKETNMTLDLGAYTILIAEDIEINQEIIGAVLEDTNVNIDFANNGLAAVSLFQENPDKFSLILMDIQMPEMDGYEATRQIRALTFSKAKEIPIIAMTANAFREDIENCLAAGMNAHLSKPINSSALYEALHEYLG